MATTITKTEVYDFAGTESTDRTTAQDAVVEGVIDRTIQLVEDFISRYVYPRSETVKVHDGRYCDIMGDKLYLYGRYYDVAEMIELTEDGTVLVENTDYVVTAPNILEKLDGFWSQSDKLNIEIEAWFGQGTVTPVDGETPAFGVINPALKEIIIEAVAGITGLWGRIVATDEGQMTTERSNLPTMSKNALKRYIQQPVL